MLHELRCRWYSRSLAKGEYAILPPSANRLRTSGHEVRMVAHMDRGCDG